MKLFLGILVVTFIYIALLWVYPYFALGRSVKKMFVVSLTVHLLLAAVLGLYSFLVWAFW